MIVDIQGGQAADVNFVLALLRQRVGKFVVQAVDALNHQYVAVSQRQLFTVVFPDALFEVEGGHIHRFALQQTAHIAVELLHVHSAQSLKIVLAVGISGGVLPVAEVVVCGDGMGPQAAGHQLGGQAVGEGGFARGGGTGDHHEADVLPPRDLLGNVTHSLFHQGFVGQNQLGGVAFSNHVIHLPYVGDIHGGGAILGVMHGLKHLHRGRELTHLLRFLQRRQAEDEAILKQLQSKPLKITGVRYHVAVEIVSEAVQSVKIDPGADAVFQEPGLILHAVFCQKGRGVFDIHRLLFNGQNLTDQLPHPVLDPVQQGVIQREAASGPAEQSIAQGKFHPDVLHLLPAYHVIKCLEHQENGTALIGLAARLVGGGDHGEGAVPLHGLLQLTELAVPVHQQDLVGIVLLKFRGDGAVSGSVGILVYRAVHGDVQHGFHRILLSNMAAGGFSR